SSGPRRAGAPAASLPARRGARPRRHGRAGGLAAAAAAGAGRGRFLGGADRRLREGAAHARAPPAPGRLRRRAAVRRGRAGRGVRLRAGRARGRGCGGGLRHDVRGGWPAGELPGARDVAGGARISASQRLRDGARLRGDPVPRVRGRVPAAGVQVRAGAAPGCERTGSRAGRGCRRRPHRT
ncbi:unnamed protein product, partial [Prorocentrum cordatum]